MPVVSLMMAFHLALFVVGSLMMSNVHDTPAAHPVADAALIERVLELAKFCEESHAADLRALCDAFEIVTRERNDCLRVQIDGSGVAAQPDPAQDQDGLVGELLNEFDCHPSFELVRRAAAEIERLEKLQPSWHQHAKEQRTEIEKWRTSAEQAESRAEKADDSYVQSLHTVAQQRDEAEARAEREERIAEDRAIELRRQKDINKLLSKDRDPDCELRAAERDEWVVKHKAVKQMYKQERHGRQKAERERDELRRALQKIVEQREDFCPECEWAGNIAETALAKGDDNG